MHKADCLWEGSNIVLEHHVSPLDPIPIFSVYLTSQDTAFPHLPDLWLTNTVMFQPSYGSSLSYALSSPPMM